MATYKNEYEMRLARRKEEENAEKVQSRLEIVESSVDSLSSDVEALQTATQFIASGLGTKKGCLQFGRFGIEWGTVTVALSTLTTVDGSSRAYGISAVTLVSQFEQSPALLTTFSGSYHSNITTSTDSTSYTDGFWSFNIRAYISASVTTASRSVQWVAIGILNESSSEEEGV